MSETLVNTSIVIDGIVSETRWMKFLLPDGVKSNNPLVDTFRRKLECTVVCDHLKGFNIIIDGQTVTEKMLENSEIHPPFDSVVELLKFLTLWGNKQAGTLLLHEVIITDPDIYRAVNPKSEDQYFGFKVHMGAITIQPTKVPAKVWENRVLPLLRRKACICAYVDNEPFGITLEYASPLRRPFLSVAHWVQCTLGNRSGTH